jgi:ATP-dependent Lhr-like helicase
MFVNTRSQAEMLFQELWRINDDGLAIALHHGSLDTAQRRKVEAAMAAGRLRAVVCTSSLDLGIDWGDVDLVINVGAPPSRRSRKARRIPRRCAPALSTCWRSMCWVALAARRS